MNKAKLVEVVGRVVSTRKEALAAVDALLNAVQHSLRSGEKVVLAGIGSFMSRCARPRSGATPNRADRPDPAAPGRALQNV